MTFYSRRYVSYEGVEGSFVPSSRMTTAVTPLATRQKERYMEKIATTGWDLAKSVFQTHAIPED